MKLAIAQDHARGTAKLPVPEKEHTLDIKWPISCEEAFSWAPVTVFREPLVDYKLLQKIKRLEFGTKGWISSYDNKSLEQRKPFSITRLVSYTVSIHKWGN